MEEREELEHVPWADLMAESEPEDRRRRTLYLVAGALGSLVLAILVARSWWAPASPEAPVTPATTAIAAGETTLATAPELPLYSEADLMADPPDPLARAAIVRAEWFVTDYFTSDFEPNGSADVRAALPAGPMPAFPQDDGDGISYVEWARAFEVEESGDGAYRVSAAFRMLGAPPDRGFSRQPVRAVAVLIGVTADGGTTVLDLPAPARMPAGPEPTPWPEGVDDPPQTIVDEAAGGADLADVGAWWIVGFGHLGWSGQLDHVGVDGLVSLLIAQGTHPTVIAARLGHTSVRTVLDVYGHLYEGLDRGAADALAPPWEASHVDAMWTRRRSTGLELGPR